MNAAFYPLVRHYGAGLLSAGDFWREVFDSCDGFPRNVVFVFDGNRTVEKAITHEERDASVAKARRKARSIAKQLSRTNAKKSRRRAKLKRLLRQYTLASFRNSVAFSNQLVSKFNSIAGRPRDWSAVVAEGEADIWISKKTNDCSGSKAIVTTDSDLLVRKGTTTMIIPKTCGLKVQSWNVIDKTKVFTITCTIMFSFILHSILI
jgi:hypothetical protein